MRGKGVRPVRAPADLGITPAYAGKRAVSPGGRKVLRDHPRLCGEKSPISADRCVGMGSPPPMRGKVGSICVALILVRITPAYAGKSHTVFPFAHVKEDHPRLCGEKALAILLAIGKLGSPPPMRGKAARFLHSLPPAGITPAYAGKRNAPWSGRTPF